MFSKISSTLRILLFIGNFFLILPAMARQDSLFLSVEQLFESGVKSSLQLQADSLKERMAYERKRHAQTALLPDLEIGLKGGVIGQPVVFQEGLSHPTYPDTPDWSQTIQSTSTNRCIREGKSAIPSVRQILKKKSQACNE